jgi:hypothetical protein
MANGAVSRILSGPRSQPKFGHLADKSPTLPLSVCSPVAAAGSGQLLSRLGKSRRFYVQVVWICKYWPTFQDRSSLHDRIVGFGLIDIADQQHWTKLRLEGNNPEWLQIILNHRSSLAMLRCSIPLDQNDDRFTPRFSPAWLVPCRNTSRTGPRSALRYTEVRRRRPLSSGFQIHRGEFPVLRERTYGR